MGEEERLRGREEKAKGETDTIYTYIRRGSHLLLTHPFFFRKNHAGPVPKINCPPGRFCGLCVKTHVKRTNCGFPAQKHGFQHIVQKTNSLQPSPTKTAGHTWVAAKLLRFYSSPEKKSVGHIVPQRAHYQICGEMRLKTQLLPQK